MRLDEEHRYGEQEYASIQSGAEDGIPQQRPELPIRTPDYAPAGLAEAHEVIGKKAGSYNQKDLDQQASAQFAARGHKGFPQPESKEDIGQDRQNREVFERQGSSQ
jgi:hypothetical protein